MLEAGGRGKPWGGHVDEESTHEENSEHARLRESFLGLCCYVPIMQFPCAGNQHKQ